MKKLLMLLSIAVSITFTSCSKYDDSEIWKVLDKYGERISALEELCKQMNTNITNLQTIVKALQENDYITNVVPIRKDGEIIGYTITFSQSDTITIYNGEDGNDGHTPQISVMAIDGIYYWMLDGEYILDANGNKLKAEGTDGLTPKFQIENDYWKISYDGEKTWTQLGEAKGENGLYNSNGDFIIKEVSVEDEYVSFILNDGKNSQIKVQYSDGVDMSNLAIYIPTEGTLSTLIPLEYQQGLKTLKLGGYYNDNDLDYISTCLSSLISLNAAEAQVKGESYNDYAVTFKNMTIKELKIGKGGSNCGTINVKNCPILETITITKDKLSLLTQDLPKLSKLIIAEGVVSLVEYSLPAYDNIYSFNICSTIELPSTLSSVKHNMFRGAYCCTVYCPILNPPGVVSYSYSTGFSSGYSFTDLSDILKESTLYVPSESIELYKTASGWKQFGTILPLEEYKE